MPGLGVAITVEDDRAVLFDDVLEQALNRRIELRGIPLGGVLQLGGAVVERLGHDGVHCHERAGDRLVGADRAELEAVAREGEGTRPVAIARVLRQRGEHVDADGQRSPGHRALGASGLDLLEDVGELIAKEDRDDRRGSFVGSEAVIVAGVSDHGPQ